MTAPRVLLVGYYGKGNFGDDVLLKVAYQLLKSTIPNAKISVIVDGDSENYLSKMLGDVDILKPGRHGNFDFIIHGGGGVFFDFATYSFVHRLLEFVIRFLGIGHFISLEKQIRYITNKPRTSAKKRIGIGIGVGTFSSGSLKLWHHSLPILADFDALWVRDADSLENLKRFTTVMKAKKILGSDLAFLTEHWMPPRTPKPISLRPRLGIILRDWRMATPEVLGELFKKLAQDYDLTGFIFEENHDPKMRALLSPYTTHIWQPQKMSIADFSTLLNAQDVLLTSRAHGAICGACLGIPSVIVNIEPKLEQVHAMLPHVSILVEPHETERWQEALQQARALTPEVIKSDLKHNYNASREAWQEIEQSIFAKPKILMLTTQLGYGGAETSFIRLANYLAQSMDVTVALFTSDYGKGAYAQGHETLRAKIVLLDNAARSNRLHRWWQRIKTARKLKEHADATISFLSGPNMVNILAGHHSSTVISLRGSRVYDPVASRWSRLLFQYILDPIAFWLATYIVPVSPGLKNEIRQVTGKKPLAKVHPISPFIDIEALQNKLAQFPPEPYAQLKGQSVIVSVGRLSIEKGFHHLIRLFAELSKTEKGSKLLLVGDGPLLPELRSQCRKLGLSIDDFTSGKTSVIFAGYQKNALPLMALGKVYAMTSSTEGFPNVVIEALAAGVPVVAADTPWGARAILRTHAEENTEPYPTHQATPAEYGILMPRIDDHRYSSEWIRMLSECLRTEKWREAYSEKGKQHLHNYDISIIGPKWQKLIHSLTKTLHR